MRIYVIGHQPFYIDKDRGETIKNAILAGAEYVSIDGEMYKASVITAITHEEEPVIRDLLLDSGIPSKPHERARLDSIAFQRYKQARQKLRI